MYESLPWIGWIGIALALFALLAGSGFRRLSIATAATLLMAAVVSALVGWIEFSVSMHFDQGGGEWRGLAAFAIAALSAGIAFLLTFLVAMVLLAMSRFKLFERAAISWPLLGAAAALLVAAFGTMYLQNPRHVSTEELVAHLARRSWNQEIEDELVHRGSAAIPALIAVTARHPDAGQRDPELQMAPLIHLLGRIGGPEANQELLRLANSQADPSVRVAALSALGETGERAAIPLIVTTLKELDEGSHYDRPPLLRALGQLHAEEYVGMIAAAITDHPPWTEAMTTQDGVAALAAIDTEEAWAAIAQLCADPDAGRRQQVIAALADCKSPRATAILLAALDDAEERVREAAFWGLLKSDPRLREAVPQQWSDANAEKMRQAIGAMQPANP